MDAKNPKVSRTSAGKPCVTRSKPTCREESRVAVLARSKKYLVLEGGKERGIACWIACWLVGSLSSPCNQLSCLLCLLHLVPAFLLEPVAVIWTRGPSFQACPQVFAPTARSLWYLLSCHCFEGLSAIPLRTMKEEGRPILTWDDCPLTQVFWYTSLMSRWGME